MQGGIGKIAVVLNSLIRYLSRDTRVGNPGPHDGHFFPLSRLHRSLSFVMDDGSALLSLLWRMPADLAQGLNHMVERIDVIVENNQLVNGNLFGDYVKFLLIIVFCCHSDTKITDSIWDSEGLFIKFFCL
jgi:hypothetical protein